MSWTQRAGLLFFGCIAAFMIYWGVPKSIEPPASLSEEACRAVYRVQEGASAHTRPSSLSRRTEVAGSELYVSSCVQNGSWHGVLRVDNNCLPDNADAACKVGWIHEANLVLIAG